MPRLVNHPFGDPGLYIAFRYQGRAMLFDLGRIDRMPAAELLKISHVFVSHTHMDHFIGFDHLLRIFLARDSAVELFGPPGIVRNVCGKLGGYTWNLVDGYQFVLTVHEVGREAIDSVRLRATTAFEPEPAGRRPFTGTLYDSPECAITTVHLDHRIPCLAFALTEKTRLNVRPERIAEMQLVPGRWLNQLKQAVRGRAPDHTLIRATRHTNGVPQEIEVPLGELREQLIVATPGQKIAYVVDTIYSADNISRIAELARGADLFFCESPFLDIDRDQARKRYHLTARQAGSLARAARVARLETFHFSPRYERDSDPLRNEAQATFRGELPPDDPQ